MRVYLFVKNNQRQKPSEILTGGGVWGLTNARSRRAQAAGIGRHVHLCGLRRFRAFQPTQREVQLYIAQRHLGHARSDTAFTDIARLSVKDIGDEIKRAFGSGSSVPA